MSLLLLPAELVLLVITYLSTRDVVVLGLTCRQFHDMAEEERAKRQDISKLLSRYVDDTHGFRRLMRITGGIIVGDTARAFFTGEEPPKELELLFFKVDIFYCLHLWIVFIATQLSLDRCGLSIMPSIDNQVRCPLRR